MIEIIGIGCRFPGGAQGPASFFRLLCSQQSAIGPVPADRWSAEDYVALAGRPQAGQSVTDRAGWLSQIDTFDTGYFHLSPREACEMDPQQRLVLEVSLEAIFDAQLHPSWLKQRNTGVFVGAGFAEFQGMSFADPAHITKHTMLGTSLSIIANRLSYFLDIHGPSMTIDTACSSALSALHIGCQSLRSGQCDVAIVAGVNTMLSPSPFIGYTQASMLSPTGTCSPFDADANGFVRGEGCGVVVLRRAEPDPDMPHRRIYAYVKADGAGEDGRTPSVTMPSGPGQQRLMQGVLSQAAIDLEDIVYVEAHGTGTPVGDPIEAGSISRAHRGSRTQPLAIGSVKGHLGHLETAAGIAGLIKGALCLYHNSLVPTVGFSRWSEKIDAQKLQLRVPVDVEAIPPTRSGGPPLLGVCSYGFGGANAYALLQQAHTHSEERPTTSEQTTTSFALPLSAHYAEGLTQLTTAWQSLPSHELREAALWAGLSRPSLRHRKVWIGAHEADFFSQAIVLSGEHAGAAPRLIFCFGGQGSQYAHMGRQLYAQHRVFRESIERADELFAAHSGYSLIDKYGFCQRDMDEATLADVTVALPCIVLSQVALCSLLREVGVTPDAVMGHSTGEMVAGWLAGAYDLNTLCMLTYIRADMQSRMQPGAMAAWRQSEHDAQATLRELGLEQQLVVAAINTEDSVTLSGDIDALEQALAWGKANGVRCLRLAVPRAYHSHHVDAIADELRQRLQVLQADVPKTPFVSSVQGQAGEVLERPLDADYWFENIRQPVDFAKACQTVETLGGIGVEVSPHRVLSGYLSRNLSTPVVASLDRHRQDDLCVLQALGQLYVRGVDIRWAGWAQPSRFVSIPALPWKHTESYRSKVWKMPGRQELTPLPPSQPSRSAIVLSPKTHPYLRDHVIGGSVVMPGAGYIAEVLQATGRTALQDIQFQRMLLLWNREPETTLQIEEKDGSLALTKGGQSYVTASWGEPAEAVKEPIAAQGLAAIRARCKKSLDVRRLYTTHARHSGLGFGPLFQGIRAMDAGDVEGVAVLHPPPTQGQMPLHTTVLDACFQSLVMLHGIDSEPWLPHALQALWVDTALPQTALFCHTRLRKLGRDELVGDCDLYTEAGQRIAGFRGLRLKRARLSAQQAAQCFTTSYQEISLTSGSSPSPYILGSLASSWPGERTDTLADADVVVDARNSLEAASALLRDVLNAGRALPVVFIYPVPVESCQPSPMLGFARAARNENPSLPVYACGLPESDAPEQQVAYLQELLTALPADEYEMMLVDGVWQVPRLQVHTCDPEEQLEERAFRLHIERPGQLSTLQWIPARPELEGLRAGEIQLRVKSVSLHFKDVMLAMGMLGDFKPILGMECCGTILALGPGVADEFPELKPGMDVMCLSMTTDVGEFRSSLLGTVATIPARQAIPKPDTISEHEAAGFLGVTATAWYSLHEIGKLQAGETVLIHSGAGGVGQAAIQIAQHLGATVISSAGSEEKRNLLRRRFGLDCVLDSHKPDTFYERVRAYTRGQGVDVVLNSLAAEGLLESLRCLGPGGRHLEIGKRDIFADRRIGLAALTQNISFHSIQLDLLDHSHPKRVRQLLLDCVTGLQTGSLKPVETTVYPADQVVEAFRLMSAGKHTGKLVIAFPDNFVPASWQEKSSQERAATPPQTWVSAQETQLITGGTRGLGLELARFLAAHGAEHIVLLGRSSQVSERTQLTLDAIQQAHPHCKIRVIAADVRDGAALKHLFATCEPAIAGVFHAANLYTAEAADALTEEGMQSYDVKVQGANNLDEASRDHRLRHFVLFSSLAGLHGNTQQAAYVAANAALQQLAIQRRAMGLPALAIDFPIMLGAGRLSESASVRELELNTGRGFGALSFSQLEPFLAQLLAYPSAAPAHVSLDNPRWDSYLRIQRYHRMYEHLIPEDVLAERAESAARQPVAEIPSDIASSASGAASSPQASEPSPSLQASELPPSNPTGVKTRPVMDGQQIFRSVVGRVAFLLGSRVEDVERHMPLTDLGVDSLAAIELSEWLEHEYRVPISQTEVLGGLTVQDILEKLLLTLPPTGIPAQMSHTVGASKQPESAKAPVTSNIARPSHVFRESVASAQAEPVVAEQEEQNTSLSSLQGIRPAGEFVVEEGSADLLLRGAVRHEAQRWVELPLMQDRVSSQDVSVTEILVQQTLQVGSLQQLLQRISQADGVLVFRARPGQEHFCTGMDLEAMSFGSVAMSQGLALFARLYEMLDAYPMPIVTVVEGACRGGGMLFPLLSSVVLATSGSSFGFPEVRRGGLPGVVSVAAQRRMLRGQCERLMLTGDVLTAERAMQLGLVDFVGPAQDVGSELQRVLGRFRTIPAETLRACATHCPAPSLPQAMVAMGGVGQEPLPSTDTNEAKVQLRIERETGVAILELNDPRRSNAMGVEIASELRRAVQQLQAQQGLRAVVFQGVGEHFCVGVNPYDFVRHVQQLPLLQAARVIYDIYRAFVGVRDLDVPVICVVHGKVVGGGLAAMLHADYRISAASTVFHYGNLPRGVCPGLLLSENLGRAVGHTLAMRLYLQDEALEAEEACSLGLVHEVLPSLEMAQQAALALARRLATAPDTGVKATLSVMRPAVDQARLAQESLEMARCLIEGGAFSGDWNESARPHRPFDTSVGKAPLSSMAAISHASNSALDVALERELVAEVRHIPEAPAKRTPTKPASSRQQTDSFTESTHSLDWDLPAVARVQHVGILAMELYTPNHCVRQEDLEQQNAQPGKYTKGLGQKEIGFCGDDEDAVSMALTVVHRLMERYRIGWHDVGRLEVGTESLTDRSKSIKTHLMSLFAEHGNYNVEGVDTYNACYGGTAALFNTVAWCQSESWDGRYGLVVCVDIADLNAEQMFLNGAAAVAMLVGPNAPLAMCPERGSHMMHTWDFYKPVGWKDSYPLMRDGKHSIDVYMESLDGCQEKLSQKLNGQCLVQAHDYFVFHCTSVYLCKRAFERVVANAPSLQGIPLQERQRLYREKVQPGTILTQRIGSSYTASCYVNLYSLLLHARDALVDKTICVYSYGSGSSASMYRLRVRSLPQLNDNVTHMLDQRQQHTPEEFVTFVNHYSAGYGRFDFSPETQEGQQPGVYYLDRVDEWGRRFYLRHS